MDSLENWLKTLVKNIGIKEVIFENKKVNFNGKWPRVKYTELIEKYSPGDMDKINTLEIDEVFKKKVRPNINDPVFVVDYPKVISPLSKVKSEDSTFTERFQLVVAGTELVNGFSELNNPLDQRERMEKQEAIFRTGNKEASRLDEDFLEALEYGMPPTAGLGIGIDRLVMLLTGAHNIKDVITFTTLKPKDK
jgi:lysyl-tRNA synthetase class 2